MILTLDDIVNAAPAKSGAPDPNTDTWREILLRDHAKANRLTERGWGIVKNRYATSREV